MLPLASSARDRCRPVAIMFCVSDRRLRSLGKANPNTSQAIANAIAHAMQWLKSALIDDIIKSLPPEYYKADENTYRESLAKNISAFQWDGIVSFLDANRRNVYVTLCVRFWHLADNLTDPAFVRYHEADGNRCRSLRASWQNGLLA